VSSVEVMLRKAMGCTVRVCVVQVCSVVRVDDVQLQSRSQSQLLQREGFAERFPASPRLTAREEYLLYLHFTSDRRKQLLRHTHLHSPFTIHNSP
jgi:hypothetical protein